MILASQFVKPQRGSREFNAIRRAVENRRALKVVKIGTYGREQYYRVKRTRRPAHFVSVVPTPYKDYSVRCDCPASYVPHEPAPCVHVAAVLIKIAQKSNARTSS